MMALTLHSTLLRGSRLLLRFAIERKRRLAIEPLSIMPSSSSYRRKLKKGGAGLFGVTRHRTVARTEAEEVEIGETEKDSDQFSECPPFHEGGEIKRALRWSSKPLDVPAQQRAANFPREAIRRAQEQRLPCCLLLGG